MKTALLLFLFQPLLIGVFGEDVIVSVMEGDSVTLHTDKKIQRNDVMTWSFGRDVIAKVNSGSSRISVSVNLDERFRDRLQLNNQTGDLKISNITVTDSGEYKLDIATTERASSSNTFNVRVVAVNQLPSVLVGEFFTLSTGVTDTTAYDVIRWKFGGQSSPIAEVNRKNNKMNLYADVPDGRFKGRLQLDYWTGSLTITNTRTEHTGDYEVDLISSSRFTVHKTFTVTVSGEIKILTVKEGDSFDLKTDAVLQTHDSALWMFGDTFIMSILNNETIIGPDETFRDRLKLDHQTGSLTIKNTKTTDSGLYEVTISSSKHSIHKKFNVMVTDSDLSLAAVVGIGLLVAAVASAATAGLICCCYHRKKRPNDKKKFQEMSRGGL